MRRVLTFSPLAFFFEADSPGAFLALWTCKEAYLKAADKEALVKKLEVEGIKIERG